MTAGCLPEELMMDILTRLPVKSLVRFECIHKSWNSLIKSFDFVITHSQNPKNRTHGSIFVAYYDHDSGNMFFRSLAPNSFDVRADLVIPSIIKQQYMIRSSCNGLLCLCNYDPCRILLYNPCLNQYKILPTSNLYHMTLSELFGFGYDSTNNDYKVVRELLSWDWEQVPRRVTEVYSLRRNSWRKLGSNIIPDDIRLCGGIRFVSDSLFNGAIHRLAYYSRNNNRAGMIVSFDVCNEEFHMFSRPNLKGCNADLKISVNRDLLSIFDLAFQVRDEVCCDIWVMKEYGVEDSWVRLHSIKLFCPRPYNGIAFLGLGMNGEIILDKELTQGHELLVYNKHEILIKTIKVEQLSYFAFGCIESLVSLDQGNQ